MEAETQATLNGDASLGSHECRLVTSAGQMLWVQVFMRRIPSSDGNNDCLMWSFFDIQSRKQFEQRLARANRALFMLSACTEAVVRATDEQTLLKEVCRIAVEGGGYRMRGSAPWPVTKQRRFFPWPRQEWTMATSRLPTSPMR